MERIYRDRLKKLANYLRTVPKHRFDLETFVDSATEKTVKKCSKHRCGTAACAVVYLPEVFPRSFYYDIVKSLKDDGSFRIDVKDRSGRTNFQAARKYFNISDTEAMNLFMPDNYPEDRQGKNSVANRIKHFINNRDMYNEEEFSDGDYELTTGVYYRGE